MHFLKNLFVIIVSITLTFHSEYLFAFQKQEYKINISDAVTIASLITGPTQFKLLAILKGIPTHSINKIDEDLKKDKVNKFPELSLSKDEFLFDGKKSGIHLVAVNPLKLKFKSYVWTYNSKYSFDENYFSLKKNIQDWTKQKKTKTNALVHLFVNSAYGARAEETGNTIVGGIVGALFAVMAVSIATIGAPLEALLGIAVLGFAAGAWISYQGGVNDDARERALLLQFLNSNFELTCNDTAVSLRTFKNDNNNKEILYNRSQNLFSFYDNETTPDQVNLKKSNIQLSYLQKQALQKFLECKNAAQALELKSKLKELLPQLRAEYSKQQNSVKWDAYKNYQPTANGGAQ